MPWITLSVDGLTIEDVCPHDPSHERAIEVSDDDPRLVAFRAQASADKAAAGRVVPIAILERLITRLQLNGVITAQEAAQIRSGV